MNGIGSVSPKQVTDVKGDGIKLSTTYKDIDRGLEFKITIEQLTKE